MFWNEKILYAENNDSPSAGCGDVLWRGWLRERKGER